MSIQFDFLNQLPKELLAKVIDYLLVPKTIFDIQQLKTNESETNFKGIVLNLVICTRTQSIDSFQNYKYSCNQTTINYNINFMNTTSDMEKLEFFINNIQHDQTATLQWNSPVYSPSQLNIITYLNNPETLCPKLIFEIYQLSHEQYCPPIPALSYNVDTIFGTSKSTSHSISITKSEIKKFIEILNKIQGLVEIYG